MGKKEEEIKKPEYGEEEATVTEFEKVKVSEPEVEERMEEEKKSHGYDESAIKAHDEVAGEVEAKGRGLFGFLGKKKEEEIKKPDYGEEEVLVTEFEKVKVSEPEPEPKVEERKEEEEEEEKPGLLEKLKRSDSCLSSSSDEEEGEEGEKKKKKKGLTEKIKEKISGEKKEEEEEVKIEKQDYDQDTSIPIEKYDDVEAAAPPAEEKKGLMEKIKEKLPGQTKKTEEAAPPPPPVADYTEGEAPAKEKKGIFEKIKEKIPGYHPKTEEEKEKEKEKECA